MSEHRDMTPAVGTPGGPGRWRRARKGAKVAGTSPTDAADSFLYGDDTDYASAARPERAAAPPTGDDAAVRAPDKPIVQGPMMKSPVWTWEVPLYFWFGGIAAGSSFVALACDLSGDQRSARLARAVAVGAVLPCPPLLIMDLGRPLRFLNMMRTFKPQSPMSMGAWCLVAFSFTGTAAVGADLVLKDRAARRLGALNAVIGGYLGSYTGVLLSSTAVPVWARSHLLLGPIFVCTGAATGASVCRLALAATGRRPGNPTRQALGHVETGAMTAELLLSQLNEARIGRYATALENRPMAAARWLVRAGLAFRLARRRPGSRSHHVASVCFLAAGLCFRYGWVAAGRTSAGDDEAVAVMARESAKSAELTHH